MLNFDKPKKLRSTEEHNREYRSEARAAGTYVPNMSQKDREDWKAKKIGGNDPRIEIRKTVKGNDPTLKTWEGKLNKQDNCYAQLLAIVRPNGSVVMSANGRMAFDSKTWDDLHNAVKEAFTELMKDEYRKVHPSAKLEDDKKNMSKLEDFDDDGAWAAEYSDIRTCTESESGYHCSCYDKGNECCICKEKLEEQNGIQDRRE
jgi:hypothetical protein